MPPTSRLRQRVRKGLLAIEGVVESPGTYYDEDACWVDAKEIAHFRGDDVLDLRLTRAEIRARRHELKKDPRVELRPGTSDWLMLHFASQRDVDFVLELAEQAAAAHRPPPGVPVRPPPTGADLAGRRRFH